MGRLTITDWTSTLIDLARNSGVSNRILPGWSQVTPI